MEVGKQENQEKPDEKQEQRSSRSRRSRRSRSSRGRRSRTSRRSRRSRRTQKPSLVDGMRPTTRGPEIFFWLSAQFKKPKVAAKVRDLKI